MHYYRFELRGGSRGERFKYATEHNLFAADHSGDYIVFYKHHPAKLEIVKKNYCAAGHDFTIEITEVSEEEATYR